MEAAFFSFIQRAYHPRHHQPQADQANDIPTWDPLPFVEADFIN